MNIGEIAETPAIPAWLANLPVIPDREQSTRVSDPRREPERLTMTPSAEPRWPRVFPGL